MPAYDHPTVWAGHGSMIEEISSELPAPPKAILCSVGGGGLLGGVLVGCSKVGYENGSSSFAVIVIQETDKSTRIYSTHRSDRNSRISLLLSFRDVKPSAFITIFTSPPSSLQSKSPTILLWPSSFPIRARALWVHRHLPEAW